MPKTSGRSAGSQTRKRGLRLRDIVLVEEEIGVKRRAGFHRVSREIAHARLAQYRFVDEKAPGESSARPGQNVMRRIGHDRRRAAVARIGAGNNLQGGGGD